MNGEPQYAVTDPMGYDNIAQKYKNGEWDILRVHQFIKAYDTKLIDSSFTSQSPQQVVLGTLILWVGWLLSMVALVLVVLVMQECQLPEQ